MRHIVVSLLASRVGYVEWYTYVGTEKYHTQVVSESYASAKGYIIAQGLQT